MGGQKQPLSPDILRSVCRRLNFVVDSDTSAIKYAPRPHQQPPCLLLPSISLQQPDHDPTIPDDGRRCLFSLQHNRAFQLKVQEYNVVFHAGSAVVGASRGWLILGPTEKEREDLCLKLFHPVSQTLIRLPQLGDAVSKAILWSEDPVPDADNFWVAAICGDGRKIALVRARGRKWTELAPASSGAPYRDVVCANNRLWALADDRSVHSWGWEPLPNSSGITLQKQTIRASSPPGQDFVFLSENKGLYSTMIYLITCPTSGDLLLAVRVIGEFVSEDGKLVREADLLQDDDTHPLVCPYRTLLFNVFKLDLESQAWVPLESVGDTALFLGGSESVGLSCTVATIWAFSVWTTSASHRFTTFLILKGLPRHRSGSRPPSLGSFWDL